MTPDLQFDFDVDKTNHTITVRREFAAGRQLVWDCYTKSELLDRWFAPETFTTKTKSMDFSEGGHWHYAMVDTDGNEYWGYTSYKTITPIDGYTSSDAFCDEAGTINTDLPGSDWVVSFSDKHSHTLVETVVTYVSLEALEAVIQMGMEDGMTSTLKRLDDLLAQIA